MAQQKFKYPFVISIFLLVLFPNIKTFGQDTRLQQLIDINFLKDSIEIEESEYVFNNIQLLNKGNNKLNCRIEFSHPDFISFLSSPVINRVELLNNQPSITPLRFMVSKKTPQASWVPITATITIIETGQKISKSFEIKIKPVFKWKATVTRPEIFLDDQKRKIPFQIFIENSGSISDKYKINIQTKYNLSPSAKTIVLDLLPGERKSLEFMVDLSEKDLLLLKKSTIDILVENSLGESRMIIQSITKIGNEFVGDLEKWNKMPLSVELNGQNLISGNQFFYYNINGYLEIGENEKIYVSHQSDNQFSGFRANTSISNVRYESLKWDVFAGNIMDFEHFIINGTGVKGRYNTKNKGWVEAAGIKSRIGNTDQLILNVLQPLNNKFNLHSSNFSNNDKIANISSQLSENTLTYTFDPSTTLAVKFGAGMESITKSKFDSSIYGGLGGYQFQMRRKKINISSLYKHYSKNFPGYNRGFDYHNHEVGYQVGKGLVGLYAETNKRIFNTALDSTLSLIFNVRNQEYGIKSGFTIGNFNLHLSGGFFRQQQDSANSLIADMYRIASNLNWRSKSGLSFYLYNQNGLVTIPERPDIKNFVATNNFGTIQYKKIGLQFRYDHMPYWYFEIRQFSDNQRKMHRVQFSPFFEQQFTKLNLYYRVQVSYNDERPILNNYFMVQNYLQYYSKKLGLNVGLISNFSNTENVDPLLNLSIRKNLNIPVLKNNSSKNFRIILFKDLNGNGLHDEGEEPIAGETIKVNDFWVQSNEKGEINFTNIGESNFKVDFSSANKVLGWIPNGGLIQNLVAQKSTIHYFGFKQSKYLIGKLFLERDESSSILMLLDGIRITATDEMGKTYTTFTNSNGDYYFNLPTGKYTVSINQALFDDLFKPVEFSQQADLVLNEKLEINFKIIQRKRQLNIKRDQ